jgi:hypothetical protein
VPEPQTDAEQAEVRTTRFLICRPCDGKAAGKIKTPSGKTLKDNDNIFLVQAADCVTTDPIMALRGLDRTARDGRFFMQLDGLAPYALERMAETLPGPFGPVQWTSCLPRLNEHSVSKYRKGDECLTRLRKTRLIPFDLDGVRVPGFDPRDPLETGILPWLRWHGLEHYSFFWQLTASQTLDNSELMRARIIMLADREYGTGSVKSEMGRYLSGFDLSSKVDTCVYDTNRIIYIGAPTFRERLDGPDLPDPLPMRSGVVIGAEHYVPIEIPPPEEHNARERLRREQGQGRAGGGGITYLPPDRELELISDLDFHGGLLNACWWLVSRHPEWSDVDIVEYIREHIAGELYGREAEMLARLDDEAGRMLEWCRAALSTRREVELIEGVAPAYPTREMPLSDALEVLTGAVRGFYGTEQKTLRQLLQGAPGLGKTTLSIDEAAERTRRHLAALWGYVQGQITRKEYDAVRRDCWGAAVDLSELDIFHPEPLIDIYGPTIELAEEIGAKVEAAGLKVAVLKGRLYRPDGEDGPALCLREGLVDAMRTDELQPEGPIVCIKMNPETRQQWRCPHWNGCAYVEQFRAINRDKPQVLIRTHAHLATDPSLVEALHIGDRQPAFTLIDENPTPSLLEIGNWTAGDLIGATHRVCPEAVPVMHKIVRAIQDGRNVIEALTRADPDAPPDAVDDLEILEELIERAERAPPGAPTPDTVDPIIAQWVEHYDPPRLPLAALKRLVRGRRLREARFNGFWLSEKTTKQGEHYIHSAALIAIPPMRLSKRVMVMDGTADTVTMTHVLPKLQTTEVHPARVAEVYQVWDRTYSYHSIFEPRENGRARRLKQEVREGIETFLRLLEYQGHRVALLGPLDAVEAITHPEPEAGADDAQKAHFGALRGLDRLKDCTAGVVFSRLQPTAYEVERMSRALFPFEELDLTGDMVQQPRGYRMADGREIGVKTWIMPDPLAQRVLHQIRESEIVQAIDRLRLIHRREPCPVYILGNTPVDITVDHIMRDPVIDPRLFKLLCRCGWTLPLLPACCLHIGRDMFRTRKQAQDWLVRTVRPALRRELPPGLRQVVVSKLLWTQGKLPRTFEVLTAADDDAAVERALIDAWGMLVDVIEADDEKKVA